MQQDSYWDFLDEKDWNMLYTYIDGLINRKKQIHAVNNNLKKNKGDIREKDLARINLNIEKKRRACYLIWFVYRYILKCATYEEAIPFMNKETLKFFKIESYIRNDIYIGSDTEVYISPSGIIVPLKRIKLNYIEDIAIILEIMYNRYELFEQLECFIRHTKNTRKATAIEALKDYKELKALSVMIGEYNDEDF